MNTISRMIRTLPWVALAPLLAVTVWAAPPPVQSPARVEAGPQGVLLRVESTVPIQGRLTDAAGHPVPDALYTLTFRVRDNAGTVLCTVGPATVATERGLFTAALTGCAHDIFDGRFLSVGVQVSGDDEMTPWLPVRPVPYAMSLRPGATIDNQDVGRGLTVKSAQTGSAGTALWAENTNATAGIGLWAKAAGEDATVISTNVSTGALFKGFGSDGGEDEFRVQNDGAIETKADSYVFIPGAAMQMTGGDPADSIDPSVDGSATYDAASTGTKTVSFAGALPAVLLGQPAEIEEVTVYYRTYGTAYITSTYVRLQHGDGSNSVLVEDFTDRASLTYGDFTFLLPEDTSLSVDSGILCVSLFFNFPEATGILVGGVRIHLGHHDLY